jgi:uncharacterized protein (TIGR03790 family)
LIRLAVSFLAAASLAAQAGSTVLIVVNQNSAVSRSIGEYYARRRGVPKANVCIVHAPEQETISRAEYLGLEAEVGKCLRSARLVESVLYIVTTLGAPLRISGSGGLDGDCAAVDSEITLLYSKLHGARPPVRGSVPNPLFNRRSAEFTHPKFPIYLVTRLAGYDFSAVRALIDRSLLARNTGRVVLDARSGRTDRGDDWLLDAAVALPSDRTLFDNTKRVLCCEKGVIGFASWGSNDANRKQRRLVEGPEHLVCGIASDHDRRLYRGRRNRRCGSRE